MDAERLRALVLSLLLGLLATACGDVSIDFNVDVGVRGSGNVITETRDVSGFDEIAALGSGTVRVSVTGTESVTIEAEDNIMPLLTTTVSGSRLELGSRESYSPTKGIVYTITVIDLVGLELSGSGDVIVDGLATDALEVTINGSGDVVTTGTAHDLEVAINGSGDYNGADLASATGSVRVSGSGSATVNITDTLDAAVSGSGSVEYLGDPVVTESVTGSGDVSRR